MERSKLVGYDSQVEYLACTLFSEEHPSHRDQDSSLGTLYVSCYPTRPLMQHPATGAASKTFRKLPVPRTTPDSCQFASQHGCFRLWDRTMKQVPPGALSSAPQRACIRSEKRTRTHLSIHARMHGRTHMHPNASRAVTCPCARAMI